MQNMQMLPLNMRLEMLNMAKPSSAQDESDLVEQEDEDDSM
jgi:hypothetical protein